MSSIKIVVSCHRSFPVPEHPLLYPVQVGTDLAAERLPHMLHDNEGDNISGKNRSYCELTAQYWAWKNVDAEYYGFFHYRRYLYPDLAEKRAYRLEEGPTEELLRRLGYEDFPALIESYDLILPKGEDMHLSVRKHYERAPFHHGKDLDLVIELLLERHPEYRAAVETYLNGTRCYFGNIFVMKRTAFHAYCGWLFPLLEEFDRRADRTSYGPQELRVDGYLAERLLGIWVCQQQQLRRLELPRVHFLPDRTTRWKGRILNALLPPGSGRRAFVKRLKG